MQAPCSLLLIAGRGQYPLLAADGARSCGVRHITAIAFRGQTSRALAGRVDRIEWVRVGQIQRILDQVKQIGIRDGLLSGQVSPSCLFHARFDRMARDELRALPVKNAHTLFGRLADLLAEAGLRLLPASLFMGPHLATAGTLTCRKPDAREQADMDRGEAAALLLGRLDIGQTVVVKDGMVLAVEAFEGTNRAIRRGAKLGGKGCVVVKTARQGHDMRFDIPVIGLQTLKIMRRAGVSALALHAGRAIVLDRKEVIAAADRAGITIDVRPTELAPAPTAPDVL